MIDRDERKMRCEPGLDVTIISRVYYVFPFVDSPIYFHKMFTGTGFTEVTRSFRQVEIKQK